MNASKTLQNILGVPQGVALQAAIMRKAASPSLEGLDDPERALRFIRSNLRGSYLFARFLVPSYAGAVFSSLTRFPPVDNTLGPLISSIVDVVRGELTNNNVFERPGECHAHYHDALEAYEAAGGDIERHVEFDATGHGPVTLEWLEYFIRTAQFSPADVAAATDLVLKVFK